MSIPIGAAHVPADSNGRLSDRHDRSTDACTCRKPCGGSRPTCAADSPRRLTAASLPPASSVAAITPTCASAHDASARRPLVGRCGGGRDGALAAAQANPPDVILADATTPDSHGLNCSARFAPISPETRWMVLSCSSLHAPGEARVEGLDAGADDYISNRSRRGGLVRVQAQIVRVEAVLEEAHALTADEHLRTHAGRRRDRAWPDTRIRVRQPRVPPYGGRPAVIGKPRGEALPEARGQGLVRTGQGLPFASRMSVARPNHDRSRWSTARRRRSLTSCTSR